MPHCINLASVYLIIMKTAMIRREKTSQRKLVWPHLNSDRENDSIRSSQSSCLLVST